MIHAFDPGPVDTPLMGPWLLCLIDAFERAMQGPGLQKPSLPAEMPIVAQWFYLRCIHQLLQESARDVLATAAVAAMAPSDTYS